MNKYNPFEKRIDEIKAADLAVLRTVSEGWYVEYKSIVPNASSIAKSISAFANTYGGWLFYGIAEKSKEEAVAGNFPGIARSELDASLQKIRQAIAHSVNPAPYFETKVIWGPMAGIGLKKDQGVICIRVPKGFASPYVHKSGVIYRRVGDGSEPKPENDRFILDQLWHRADDVRKHYQRWLKRDPEFSKSEKHQPYLRLFITPDLWGDHEVFAELDTDTVRSIFSDATLEDTLASMPFDTVYRSSAGYIGRQVKGNNPQNLTATWYLKPTLRSVLLLPLPMITEVETSALEEELAGYKNAYNFSRALEVHGHARPKIIDLNFIFSALLGAFHIQSKLDQVAKRQGSIFVKSQLINVWRARPFLDLEQVVSYQLQHGIPMCMNDEVYAPAGLDPKSFVEISANVSNEDEKMHKLMQAVFAFEPIAAAMGLETGLAKIAQSESSHEFIYSNLIQVVDRAKDAVRLRNERQFERGW